MSKRLLLLYLALISLLSCVQSEGMIAPPPPYKLEPVEWLDQNTEYTVIGYEAPIIADSLMLALMRGAEPRIGSDEDTVQTTMKGDALLKEGFYVLSVSPDGQRVLCSEGNGLYLLMDTTLRAVSLNLSRCAVTIREGAQQSIRYFSRVPAKMVGSEGFHWSPDGKYICLINAVMPIRRMQPIPLMLLDTQKGEAFSIRAYEKGKPHAFNTAMQGLFSPDSKYLYYTELRDHSARLYRYDLAHETHELLADTHQMMMAYPALGMNENGDIFSVMSAYENTLLTFREGPGGWSFTQKALPHLSVSHFAASGQGATMEQYTTSGQPGKLQLVKVNGKMWRISAKMENNTVHFTLSMPYETTYDAFNDIKNNSAEDEQTLRFLHVAMNPSGSRYLLVTELQNEEKSLQLYLLNARMDEPPRAIVLPKELEISRPFLQRENPWYAAGMVFLTDDLLLVPGEANHTQLYRLVRGEYDW